MNSVNAGIAALSHSPVMVTQRATETVVIPLPDLPRSWLSRYRWALAIGIAAFALFDGVVWRWFGPLLSTHPDVKPYLAVMMSVGLCFPLMAPSMMRTHLRRALRVTGSENPEFIVNATGVRIPLLMLFDPAFTRAVKHNEPHLVVPWSAIVSWSIGWRSTGLNRATEVHALQLKAVATAEGSPLAVESSEATAEGAPVEVVFYRAPLRSREGAVLAAAQQYLSFPIKI